MSANRPIALCSIAMECDSSSSVDKKVPGSMPSAIEKRFARLFAHVWAELARMESQPPRKAPGDALSPAIAALAEARDMTLIFAVSVIQAEQEDAELKSVSGFLRRAVFRRSADAATSADDGAALAVLSQTEFALRADVMSAAIASATKISDGRRQLSQTLNQLLKIKEVSTAREIVEKLGDTRRFPPWYSAFLQRLLRAEGRILEGNLQLRQSSADEGGTTNNPSRVKGPVQGQGTPLQSAFQLRSMATPLFQRDRLEEAFALVWRNRALLNGDSAALLWLISNLTWKFAIAGTADEAALQRAIECLPVQMGYELCQTAVKCRFIESDWRNFAIKAEAEDPSFSFWVDLASNSLFDVFDLKMECNSTPPVFREAVNIAFPEDERLKQAVAVRGFQHDPGARGVTLAVKSLGEQWYFEAMRDYGAVSRALNGRARNFLERARRSRRGALIFSVHNAKAIQLQPFIVSLAPSSFGLHCVSVSGGFAWKVAQYKQQTAHLPLAPELLNRGEDTVLGQVARFSGTLRGGGVVHLNADWSLADQEEIAVPWLLVPHKIPLLPAKLVCASGCDIAFGIAMVNDGKEVVVDLVDVPVPPVRHNEMTRARWLTQRVARTVRATFLEQEIGIADMQIRRGGGLPAQRRLIPAAQFMETFADVRESLFGRVLLEPAMDGARQALLTPRSIASFADLRRRGLACAAMIMHFQDGKPQHVMEQRTFRDQHRVMAIVPQGELALALALGTLAAGSLFCMCQSDIRPADALKRVDIFQPDLIITCAAIADSMPDEMWRDRVCLICDDDCDGETVDELTQGFRPAAALPAFDSLAPALTVFTSGSTGQPKGVTLNHQMHSIGTGLDRLEGLGPDDRIVYLTRWDAIGLADLLAVLRAGASLHVPEQAILNRTGALLDYLKRHAITAFSAPSTLWHMLALSDFSGDALPLLKMGLLWGERIRWPLVETIAKKLPQTGLRATFGASEVSYVSYGSLDQATDRSASPGGRVVPGHQVRIMLEDNASPAGASETGRIEVTGPDVMLGYFDALFQSNAPVSREISRKVLLEDIVMLDSAGDVCVLGRRDSVVKIAGRRVSLIEIEAAAESVTGVARALAFLRPGRVTDEVLLAVESADIACEPAVAEAIANRTFAAARPTKLLRYDHFPMLPGGKIDRAAIQRHLQDEPSPVETAEQIEQRPAQRMTAEDVIAAIASWAAVSKRVPVGTTVSGTTSLDAGGPFDSMGMIELLLHLEGVLGYPLPLHALSGKGVATVGGFATAIATASQLA